MIGSGGDVEKLIGILRNSLIFLAIPCYLFGWIYANEYFYHLGVSFTDMQFPLYYYFIYALPVLFNPISSDFGLNFLYLLVFVTSIFFYCAFPGFWERMKNARAITYYIMFLVYGVSVGYEMGFIDANGILNNKNGRIVYLTFRQEFMNEGNDLEDKCNIVDFNNKSLLRYIWQDDRYIYVTNVRMADANLPSSTFFIRKEDVLFMRLSEQADLNTSGGS